MFVQGAICKDDHLSPIVINYNLGVEVDGYHLVDGLLFKRGSLCIPCDFVRELLVM